MQHIALNIGQNDRAPDSRCCDISCRLGHLHLSLQGERVMRIFLIVASVCWTLMVYGLHQALGYDPADGYRPAFESIQWTALLSSPLWVAAAFYPFSSRVAVVMRWAAAIALLLIVYLMLAKTWMFSLRPLVDGRAFTEPMTFIVYLPPLVLLSVALVLVRPEARRLRSTANKTMEPTR